jgi:hypothetical protein
MTLPCICDLAWISAWISSVPPQVPEEDQRAALALPSPGRSALAPNTLETFGFMLAEHPPTAPSIFAA